MLVRPRQVEWIGILHYAVHLPGYAVRVDWPQQSVRHRCHSLVVQTGSPSRPMLARSIPAVLWVVDGDTVDVLDPEASTSVALRWLDHCRGVRTLMCVTRHVCADHTI